MKSGIFIKSLLVASCAAAVSAPALADRSDTYEFAFLVPYLNGETFDFDGGASTTINSDPGFGFSLGYNYSNHLNVRGNFLWNDTSYDSVRVLDDGDGTQERVRGVLDTFTANVAVDYNFFRGDFTPFISANLGWTAVDSNIASGPPSSACWWDAWWGYICDYYQPTYTADEFSYGVGAGLRLDLSRRMFGRIGYYERWMDIEYATDSPSISSVVFEFGYMY